MGPSHRAPTKERYFVGGGGIPRHLITHASSPDWSTKLYKRERPARERHNSVCTDNMNSKRSHTDAFPEDEEVIPLGESHWDWLPPLVRDTILFWKAVAEHRLRMPTLCQEIETLCHCNHCKRRPLHRRIRSNRWILINLKRGQDFFDVTNLRCGRGHP